jgi:UDP-N-acetylglucosamine transferase subunit ALG13
VILVTVGTGLPFDELIRVVDEAAGQGMLGDDDVLFQTGRGAYRPAHGRAVIWLPNIRPIIRDASLIICHGGMTVFECLLFEKPFVAVPNPRVSDNHQLEFLRALSERLPIVWTMNPVEVPKLVKVHSRTPIDTSVLERPFRDMAAYLSKTASRT